MTGGPATPNDCAMEARQHHLTEHRARIERRRGYMIITATTMFAIAARIMMF